MLEHGSALSPQPSTVRQTHSFSTCAAGAGEAPAPLPGPCAAASDLNTQRVGRLLDMRRCPALIPCHI